MENTIAEHRKRQGMTQQQLADAVAAARQTIIALEQGRYNPSLLLAFRITRALGAQLIEDVFHLSADECSPP
jgi:putative transcriptional regulator